MSILNFGLFFIISFIGGYFVHKTNWKLRYLTPLCFFVIFFLSLFILSILFPEDWMNSNFFSIGGPNQLAKYALIMSFVFSSSTTMIIIVIVWAIRNKVF